MTGRIGWLDCSSGVSGDMLLGACLDAGVDLGVVRHAVDALGLPEAVSISTERVRRGGLAAARALVEVASSTQHRRLGDVLALLQRGEPAVAATAARVFTALAAAEARVHGTTIEEVHFHEVGALDAIADVVGVVAAVRHLGLDRLVAGPIALGGGRVSTAHGPVPVPGPAVTELLRAYRAPGFGGPIETELATPTGVALTLVLADGFGPMPALRPVATGIGAGTRDPAGHPNVVRLVVGEALEHGAAEAPTGGAIGTVSEAVVLEANVDDLDPRLWPQVLAELLAAGASDAWLTPILMKKGRAAHTLSVLAEPERAEALMRIVFAHTSTIGLRQHPVGKVALEREIVRLELPGGPVRVKIARLEGRVVGATPEYDDVAALAAATGLPGKVVMEQARAAAAGLLG
jgi:pyridinium-3,5-bisthiocarboxylic acid mononucleotide nickel chelatase